VCMAIASLVLNFLIASGTASETSCTRGGLAAMSTNGSCMLQQTVAGEKVQADETDTENLEWLEEEKEKQLQKDDHAELVGKMAGPAGPTRQQSHQPHQPAGPAGPEEVAGLAGPTRHLHQPHQLAGPAGPKEAASELQLDEDTKKSQCNPTVRQQWKKTRDFASVYFQALQRVGANDDDAYINLFEDKIMVSDPVGSNMVTEKTDLPASINKMRTKFAPLGFDIKLKRVSVAAPTFAAIYSTVTPQGSNTSLDRAEIIEFTTRGTVKRITAHWYMGALSGQRAVTSGWIQDYFKTMDDMATGKANIKDYLALYDDDVVSFDPVGKASVKGKNALLQHVASMMSKMPQGTTVTTQLTDWNVGTDSFSGCGIVEGSISTGAVFHSINCFRFTPAGQIKDLSCVYHSSELGFC